MQIALDEKESKKRVNQLQKSLGVFIVAQNYADSRTGTSTVKITYRAHHTRAREFGILDPDHPPRPNPKVMTERNGKIMSYVHFEGGVMDLSNSALQLFEELEAEG